MNEKPVKLPMNFGEALARLARTPKTAIDAVESKLKSSAAAAKSKATDRPKKRKSL